MWGGLEREQNTGKTEGWRTNGFGSQPGKVHSVFTLVQTPEEAMVATRVRLPGQSRAMVLDQCSLRCVFRKKQSSRSRAFCFAKGSVHQCAACAVTPPWSVHGSGLPGDLPFRYRIRSIPGKRVRLSRLLPKLGIWGLPGWHIP